MANTSTRGCPTASSISFLDAAHYAWEDVADQYAAIISAWVMGGYQNTGA